MGWLESQVTVFWDHAKAVHENVLLNAYAGKYIL